MCEFARTVSLALLTAAVLVIGITTASAATFDFSFSGGGYSGSGAFTSSDTSSPFLITGISGSVSDPNVNSGAASAITGLGSFGGPDNLLRSPQPYMDFNGISFDTASAGYNVFFSGFVYEVFASTGGPSFDLDVLTVTQEVATPLPAALPLFATGIGGLGLLGWRRKWKAQTAPG
jgi:hypothetical protein